jgi:hypothetical protein
MENAMLQKITAFGRKYSRSLILNVLAPVGLALILKVAVAESFIAKTATVSPEVPTGSFVIVYKLASQFAPGDIIAYRDDATTFLGRVVESNDGSLQVARDNKAPEGVARKAIIGRVVVATR